MNNIEPKWDFRDNFITVIDDALPHDFCDYLIDAYHKASDLGMTMKRKEPYQKHTAEDQALLLGCDQLNIPYAWEYVKQINGFVEQHYQSYAEKYNMYFDLMVEGHKIQKTEKSEGFHQWHYDGGDKDISNRLITYLYYLNDVEEGGETEFLYQSTRIKPKKGMGIWFPAAYTHFHRGNPPISGTKYILTGWLQYAK